MIDKRRNKAVSEIVGTVMLLGIAIAMFTLVQLFAFTLLDENPNSPSVRLFATIDDNTIYVFHNGGEELSLDTKIIFTIDDNIINRTAKEIINSTTDNGDKFWNIGEKLSYSPAGSEVSVIVVDVSSNSVIMRTIFQE